MAKSKFEHTIGSFEKLGDFKKIFKDLEEPKAEEVKAEKSEKGSEPENAEKESVKEEQTPPKNIERKPKESKGKRFFTPFAVRVRKEIDRLGKEFVTNRKKSELYEKKGDKKLASEYREKANRFSEELEKAKAARDRIKEKENHSDEQVAKPKEIREKIKDEKNPASNKEEKISLKNITKAMKEGKPMEVEVKRTSGKIEEGWLVTNIINDGDAVVIKEVDGRLLKKLIPLEELRKLNRDKIKKEEENQDFPRKSAEAPKREVPEKRVELSKLEELERQLEAAKRAGDEEMVAEIAKDVADFKKPVDQLLEEAQTLEAGEKFKIAKREDNGRQGQIKELWKKYAGEENKKEEKLEKEISEKRRALAREYSELKEKKLGIFGSEKIKDEEKARRVAAIEKDYRDSLNAYRSFLWNRSAQEMKSIISDKEIEKELRKKGDEILAKTVVDEAIKFNDLKTEISLESNGKSRMEKILRISKRAVERYRKIPPKYKYMFSATMLLGGMGVGYVGGVVGWSLASGLFAGRWFQRIFGAPAAVAALEARIRQSQEKQEKRKIFKKFKSLSPSLIPEGLSAMNKNNEKWNKELFKSEGRKKRKKISRFTLSGGIGAIILSGAIGHAMSSVWDWLHGTTGNIATVGGGGGHESPHGGNATPEKIGSGARTPEPEVKHLTPGKASSLHNSLHKDQLMDARRGEGGMNYPKPAGHEAGAHKLAGGINHSETDAWKGEGGMNHPEISQPEITDNLISHSVDKTFDVPSWTYPEFSNMKMDDFMNLKDDGFYDVNQPWATPWVDYDHSEFSGLQEKIVEIYKNLPASAKGLAMKEPVKEFIKNNFSKLFNTSK